mmetsp:Transcript_44892/g.105325  ORF Transcript_44892/g.105325 Transcript_44892/m.105325 type:complete len:232 (-) Transcript_44892:1651-2346(-)
MKVFMPVSMKSCTSGAAEFALIPHMDTLPKWVLFRSDSRIRATISGPDMSGITTSVMIRSYPSPFSAAACHLLYPSSPCSLVSIAMPGAMRFRRAERSLRMLSTSSTTRTFFTFSLNCRTSGMGSFFSFSFVPLPVPFAIRFLTAARGEEVSPAGEFWSPHEELSSLTRTALILLAGVLLPLDSIEEAPSIPCETSMSGTSKKKMEPVPCSGGTGKYPQRPPRVSAWRRTL